VEGTVRFTIVTPVLNGMPWLPEAIISVARQRSVVDLQHIVLDAGSTDGSREWLQGHTEYGCELRFEPDDGQTDALIKGFSTAQGEILGWLNADDVLEPEVLGRVRDLFVANPDVVMISGACLFIDAAGRIVAAMSTPPEATFHALVTVRAQPPQPSTFFRADAYRNCGGLDRRFNLAMDMDLWLRLVRQGRYLVLPNEVLARYRVHAGAKSERMATLSAREDLRARRDQGMPWRSPAGVDLIRAAYVRPVVRPVRRSIMRLVRRLVQLGGHLRQGRRMDGPAR
jgi:glycosyltransferase involved in cell wall biosynthesis